MKIDKITISIALNNAQKILQETGIETYKLDAKILLSHILNLPDSENLIFKLNEEIPLNMYFQYINLVERRLKFEPVAYIIGSKHFWKQSYTINNNVLIPRPETELIIELILKNLKSKIDDKFNILDLGTGSGCMILSLLSELKSSIGLGIDISEEALNIAKLNAKKFDIDRRVNFRISNWFSNIENTNQFDIIISNPPYISISEWKNLEPSVLNYEPKNALTDHTDGVENYKIIAKNAKPFLKNDGIIILEMGFSQSKKIREIFHAKGYEIEIFKDLQSIDRIAIIRNSS